MTQYNPTIALSITQLNHRIRLWLEEDIGEVAVIGELSNLSKPNSGHYYFTLKDSQAQIRCVHFKNHHKIHSKQFKDGQLVIATGRLSLYEARGDYQLIVYDLAEAGIGDLFKQFEELKLKLQALGLFDAQRKKSLPHFPTVIGIISSPTGAALQDILITLARRYPLARINIYPSEVQGKDAALQLIRAIKKANDDNQANVLILARGGGSIEDLWAFNHEQLAYAISESKLPIVTGIGHETDFTIADFVADLRAPTPTGAAEAVTPNCMDLLASLKELEQRALSAIINQTRQKQLMLAHRLANILSPQQLISAHWQTLDFFEHQLSQALNNLMTQKKESVKLLIAKLQGKHPQYLLSFYKSNIQRLEQLLLQQFYQKLAGLKQGFVGHLAALNALSPLATLERGYAIATLDSVVIFNTGQVKRGDTIHVQLAQGSLNCDIRDVNE